MNRIKHRALGAALAVFCMLATVPPATAQGDAGRDTKKQLQLDLAAARANRKALIGANMALTKAQADAFWPLYDAYEAKMDKLEDRHVAELKAYRQHYETLTDEDATNKLDEVMAIRRDTLDVQKEFIPKFRAAVSSINTTRFFQIDSKLNAMIQCHIAQIIPLASPGVTTTSE